MMIHLHDGRRINSRFVKFHGTETRTAKNGHEYEAQYVIDDEGRRHELAWEGFTDSEAGTIVPAPQPMFAYEIVFDPEGNEFFVHKKPIVGWFLRPDDYPMPIFVGALFDIEGEALHGNNFGTFIALGDDYAGFQETGYEGGFFRTLTACKEYVRKQCLEREKRKEAAK